MFKKTRRSEGGGYANATIKWQRMGQGLRESV